jgi:hypothetical protein
MKSINFINLKREKMSNKKCCSRFCQFFTSFKESSPVEIIIYITLMFFIFISFIKNDTYYFYVPTGEYMSYIEYILLISIIPITIYQNTFLSNADIECKPTLSFLQKSPKLYLLLNLIFNFFIAYFFLYLSGLSISTWVKDYTYKTYKVRIYAYSKRGSKACRPNIKTNFLDQLNIENETFFHQFIHQYHFDKICLSYANTSQLLYPNSYISIKVKESKFGVYVYEIP